MMAWFRRLFGGGTTSSTSTPRHVVLRAPAAKVPKAPKRLARLRTTQAVSSKPWSKRRMPRDSAEWRQLRKMSVRARLRALQE